jgi:hypothetical protein
MPYFLVLFNLKKQGNITPGVFGIMVWARFFIYKRKSGTDLRKSKSGFLLNEFYLSIITLFFQIFTILFVSLIFVYIFTVY